MNDFSIREKPVPNPPPHVVLLGAGASRAAFPKGDRNGRMCHVELIDIASPDHLSDNWKEFIPYSHVMHDTDFFESSIARWPRRTFEWKRNASIYGLPSMDVGICKTESLLELQDWFRALGELEEAEGES